ncbi:MAG: ketoacyl-ACP synthase III [Nitratireductor sp.]|nr:ketoacyl-ACP synthase III [Nitratireductor sp.]
MPLEAFAHAVPSVKHTAADIARLTGADPAFVENKVGLKTRYVLGPGETGVSLSQQACENLFAANPGLKEKISVLVCVTQTPDHPLPQNSAALASALGLPHSTASFDLSLGCSGYVYGVLVMQGFLKSIGAGDGLLVTCDPYSRKIEPHDKNTNAVFGDAATATWITAGRSRATILATDFGTDGERGDAIMVPAGGAALPLIDEDGNRIERTKDELRLHMKGRPVFNFVNSEIPLSIRRCLDRAGLAISDIDWFALHQGSIYMLDAMAKRVGVPPAKVLKNMDRFGNTVSSTIPLLLEEAEEKGMLKGSTFLLSGFGVGLSWSTAVVRFE